MSDFSDLLEEGFDLMLEQAPVAITVGAVTKNCILTPLIKTRGMRDAGYLEDVTCTAELKRTDFVALGIVMGTATAVVTVSGKILKVVQIDDDTSDPTVRLQLKPERAVV